MTCLALDDVEGEVHHAWVIGCLGEHIHVLHDAHAVHRVDVAPRLSQVVHLPGARRQLAHDDVALGPFFPRLPALAV